MRASPSSLAAVTALVLVLGAGLLGCEQKPSAGTSSQGQASSEPAGSAEPASARPAVPSASAAASAPAPERVEPSPSAIADPKAMLAQGLRVGEPQRVGPAAPVRAASDGRIVMVTNSDELVVLSPQDKSRYEPTEQGQEQFRPSAPPALTSTHAYFAAKRGLLRVALDGASAAEVIAADAFPYTRVAALPASPKHPAVVGFLSASRDTTVARVWVEKSALVDVTPEGAAATSVDLVALEDAILVLSLEARTAMTPVHARRLEWAGRRLEPREDVVVWVGGSATSPLELTGAARQGGAWAFVAMEKSFSEFGLAWFQVAARPVMEVPVSFRLFPRGIDPAPASAASVCGAPRVAYATSSNGPGKELHIAKMSDTGIEAPLIVASSGAFRSVSLTPTKAGAILTYVADRASWAVVLSCTS